MHELKTRWAAGVAIAVGGAVSAEVVRPDLDQIEARPGDQVSVLWQLHDNTIPLFGYSLDINLTADTSGDRQGVVGINTDVSNFHDDKNLIVAAGGSRDPIFSVIMPDGDGGAFISTNSDDGSTFTAEPGMNDVLAEVVFDVSADALGSFVFELGPGSALSDTDGFAVPFSSSPLEIVVVPAPATTALAALATMCARRRRRG